jgi:hypothetical protein
MKTRLLLLLLVCIQISYAQQYEVTFDQFYRFKNGTSLDYFELIKKNNLEFDTKNRGGNKYIFDLSLNEAKLYFQGSFIKQVKIKTHSIKNDLLIVELLDFDKFDNSEIPVYCVLNLGDDYSKYPYFMFYYDGTNQVEGYLVPEKPE